jgi:hypothetical protein
VVWLGAPGAYGQEAPVGQPIERSAIEFSPVSPFIRIYAAQYARRLTDKDELLSATRSTSTSRGRHGL